MECVECIASNGTPLVYIIRSDLNPLETTFLTPPEFNLQLGFIVYPAGGEVVRHEHRPLERHIVGTSEVLIVRTGRCEIEIYNDERELVTTREMRVGDIMFIVGGGHGFRMLENTVLLEVKQGPYDGEGEKVRF